MEQDWNNPGNSDDENDYPQYTPKQALALSTIGEKAGRFRTLHPHLSTPAGEEAVIKVLQQPGAAARYASLSEDDAMAWLDKQARAEAKIPTPISPEIAKAARGFASAGGGIDEHALAQRLADSIDREED